MRQDLLMWLTFLKSFNGISMFNEAFWTFNSDVCLYTDSSAAADHGFCATFGNQLSIGVWPIRWHESGLTKDITILEFFPLLVAIHIWGTDLRNKKVLFRCDNQAVVNIVNRQTSKSDKVMVLVRAFTLHCLRLNIVFKAEYLPGKMNCVTDSLSRLQLDRFRRLAPQAEQEPKAVPRNLWNIFEEELLN